MRTMDNKHQKGNDMRALINLSFDVID